MNFKLQIPNPCSENWNQMENTTSGKHCELCSKNLIDFRALSSKKIYDLVNTNQKVCGRITQNQLDSFYKVPQQKQFSKVGLLVSFTSLLAFVNPVKAVTQNFVPEQTNINQPFFIQQKLEVKTSSAKDTIVIKGVVSDGHTNELLPFVNVFLKGTKNSVATDFDGQFTLKIPKADFIVPVYLNVEFKFIGYETQNILIDENTTTITIQLRESADLLGDMIIVYIPTRKEKFFDFFRRKKNKKYSYCH